MKIGFLLQDIGVIYGAQRATLDLLRMLAAAGVEAHVALMRETRRTDLPADFRTALAGCATVTGLPVDRAFSPALARGGAGGSRRSAGSASCTRWATRPTYTRRWRRGAARSNWSARCTAGFFSENSAKPFTVGSTCGRCAGLTG
jgi:hypothetical protein